MKVSYLFPIFKGDDGKSFFDNFFLSTFYKQNKNHEIFICVSKDDKENYDFAVDLFSKNTNIIVKVYDSNFSYNKAFKDVLPEIKGDILLLGDCKIRKMDLVFEKCLEKNKLGAKIVFVSKKKTGFKGNLILAREKFYNLFVRMFTYKNDRCNIISLGLYDKDIINLLQVLPDKNTFLKNTKDYYGFETKTIYIDRDIETYKAKKSVLTFSLKTTITCSVLLLTSILLIIFGNIFLSINKGLFNFITIFLILLFIMLITITLPMHFFDCRNKIIGKQGKIEQTLLKKQETARKTSKKNLKKS